MSIIAAIPSSDQGKNAAIEPASARPQFFLCRAKTPPTIANIPTKASAPAIIERIIGTNTGIACISGITIPGIPRAELLKEALRKHQDSLEGELRNILKDLELPHSDFAPLSWYRGNDSIFTATESIEKEEERYQSFKVGRKSATKTTTVLDLLRQHLKNDKLWKWLAQWEKRLASHLADRKALQRKAVAILEEKTGYEVGDYRDKVTLPFLCSYTAGHLLYKSALDSAFGTLRNDNMEDDMIADTQRGAVTYHNSILAEAPDHEEVTRSNILAAYRELLSSYELMYVINTFGILQESVTRVRQAVEEILLLGFIPGQCDVCRRLGL